MKFLLEIKKSEGFSILEMLVSLAIFSMILLAVLSILFSMNNSNAKAQVDREVQENGRGMLDILTYEIRAAKSVYTPTSSATQLSLETTSSLPNGETTTYIDFFKCATALCLKREGLPPSPIHSKNIMVNSLTFTQVTTNGQPSIKIDMTLSYLPGTSTFANTNATSSISLSTVVALRNR